MKIYVPIKEGPLFFAAEIFADLAEKMTGKPVAVSCDAADPDDLILLGGDDCNGLTAEKIFEGIFPALGLRLGSDDFRLLSGTETESGRRLLCIAGGRHRALLYGVYAYFERLGCAWFQDGDVIPRRETLPLDGIDVRESPRFRYRMIRYFAHRGLKRFQAEFWDWEDWKRELDYLVKRRFNLFMLRIGLDDLFQKAFPELVSYPANAVVAESIPRSYDDRDLFWPLQYRGELRKKILDYARKLDLLHPEDVGTITHWYSRTPLEYLDKVKPAFIPQSRSAYHEDTGLAWDIRRPENLDAYFALTEAHIRHYGAPEIFHTIGLAERLCYADREKNHAFKLYIYRRIIGELRRRYPHAPLLIGTWDFSTFWSASEVRDLVAELDPACNLIFDYTADTDDPERNFTRWGIAGRFPWIFGIFSAYESETDLRGNYPWLGERLKLAAADPYCEGLALWPECSHSDILLQEFAARNAWAPVHTDPEELVRTFCADRYREHAAPMNELWLAALPLIETRTFVGPVTPRGKMAHEIIFNVLHVANYRDFSESWLTAHRKTLEVMQTPVRNHAPALLQQLAAAVAAGGGEWMRRDWLDLARMAVGRVIHYHWSEWIVRFDRWRRRRGPAAAARRYLEQLAGDYRALGRILAASPEFSLNATLEDIFRHHPAVANFEYTLKGNAANHYCRSYVAELFDTLYLPEFAVYREFAERKIRANERDGWPEAPAVFAAAAQQIEDRFFDATPLQECRPDRDTALAALPGVLQELGIQLDKFYREEFDV